MRGTNAILGLLLGTVAGARADSNADNPITPLPRDAYPLHYRIDLNPDASASRFKGEMSVTVEVTRATRDIVMNSRELQIQSARLDGRVPARIAIDPPRQRVTFSFPDALPVGRHELEISYSGPINDQIEGLFKVDYPAAGGSKRMLLSHMCCAANGRRLAPLWDDPGLKATFDLSLVVPQDLKVVSNMPEASRGSLGNGTVRVTFGTTPKMSSYLLFAGAGDFERISRKLGAVDVGIITQAGKAERGRFSLDVVSDSLQFYGDYFGIPYSLPKLDSIAMPGSGNFGAMENWGAIFFTEPFLLIDPALSTEADRQRVYDVVAHEVAHQWFGNLVTMQWWDDLWLNESFATWMATTTTHAHHPDWDAWLHAGEARERAMQLDARDITHPIVHKVTTVEEADAFDVITYEKGQAVLRMLEGYVGADAFRAAIRAHIARHAYGNATTSELWSQLDREAGLPASSVAIDFTMQGGIPLIDVLSSRCDSGTNTTEVSVRQGRFGLDDASREPRTWKVPVTAIRVGSTESQRQIVSGTTPSRFSLKGCGAVKINGGESGYYRVRYSPEPFAQLQSVFAQLPAIDQYGLLSDTYALAIGGYSGFDRYFALTRQLTPNSNPIVLMQFVRAIRELDRLYADLSGHAAFQRYARGRFGALLDSVGWQRGARENPNTSILRAELISLLVELGDEKTRQEIGRIYQASLTNREIVSGDLRGTVLEAVGVDADVAMLEQLMARAKAATDSAEQNLFLNAAAQPRDAKVAARALEMMSSGFVSPKMFPSLVYAIAARHPQLVFDRMVERYQTVKTILNAPQQVSFIPTIAASGFDPALLPRLRKWGDSNRIEGTRYEVRRATSDITLNARIRSEGLPQIDALLASEEHRPAASSSAMPAEIYARAQKLLPGSVQGLVLNAYLVPHWIGKSDEFWYDREARDGHEFVVVDAVTGARRAAFDHQQAAGALARISGQPIDARALPFRQFSFSKDRSEILFSHEGKSYALDLSNGEIRIAAAAPAQPGLLPSPDGKRAIAQRGGNLWLRDLASGEERQLTEDGEPNAGYGIWTDGYQENFVPRMKAGAPAVPVGLQWSPDGRWILVPWFDQRHVEPYPMIDSAPQDASLRPKLFQPRLALVGEAPVKVAWYAIDVDSGARRKVDFPVEKLLDMQADILPITATSWRGDGLHIYATAHGTNMQSAWLFDIDMASGAARTVIEDRVLPRTDLNTTSYNLPNVWVSPDGRDAIWFSQRDGWGHLYLYDVASGRLRKQLTRGDWLVREIIRVDPVGRVVYFTAAGRESGNPYHRYLYRVGFDGGGLRKLTPEPADHLIMPTQRLFYTPDGATLHETFSPSGKYFVYTFSTVSQPPRSAIRATQDGRLIAGIEDADASALYAAGWRAPEEFTALAADGKTPIHGVLYKPSDFDPSRRYPILDAQYASPLIAVVPRNFYQSYAQEPRLDQAAYAELGFIVMTVDGRGTTGRSKAFSQVMYGHLDTNGLEDHVAALRQLAEKRPYMDLERVGIYGVSYGGYMTLRAMLEFPQTFKVGIATAGIAVMPGMFADYHWSAFQGLPKYLDGGVLRPSVGAIPQNWARMDARTQVAGLQGKLLIELSELDENALPAQMLTFVDALVEAGKPFDMLFLPGRDHFLLGSPYVLQRNWDFMVRNLLAREPPTSFRLSYSRN